MNVRRGGCGESYRANDGSFQIISAYGGQGEDTRDIKTPEERDNYDADPGKSNYIGGNIEYFFWDFEKDTYSNITFNEFYTNAKDFLRPKYARFNFEAWNK